MRWEHWAFSLPLWLRSLFRRGRVEQELDEELRFHMDGRIAQEVAAGRSAEEARAMVVREMGGLEYRKEECRDMRKTAMIETSLRDVRLGLRVLAKSPSFTAMAVLTLTLGIGANTAIFSVVNAVLLRPLPYPESGRLVRLYETSAARESGLDSPSVPNFEDWRTGTRSFSGMSAVRRAPFALSGDGNPEFVFGERFTPGMLALLKVQPAIGRDFVGDDFTPGGDRVAILSHDLWMRRFGGDRSMVGRTIRLNSEPYTVIGVMPEGFRTPAQIGPGPAVELLLPLVFTPTDLSARGQHNLQAYGRLRPGVSMAEAQSDLDAVAARLSNDYETNRDRGARLALLLDQVVGKYRTSLRILFAAAVLILLIACANLANALLARGVGQQREIALRVALGAGRLSIVRQFLIQNLLLTSLGCGCGVGAAYVLLRVLRLAAARQLPRVAEIALDGQALAFAAAISLATGLAFGLLPAVHLSRAFPADAIKTRGMGAASASLLRWRGLLVIAQVALSMLLLAGAGLLLKSFAKLNGIDVGFQPGRTLAMKILLPASRYPDQAKRIEFFDRLTERVTHLPGVESAGYTTQLPMRGGWGGSFQVEAPEIAMGPHDDADFQIVSPGYFGALRIRLLRGRLFDASDVPGADPVVIINSALARRYWPTGDPIGRHLTKNGTVRYTVVGVVEDVRLDGPAKAANIEIYFASGQAQRLPVAPGDFVVRTVGDPRPFANAIQREVWALDREQPVTALQTMNEALSDTTANTRFYMELLVFFAGLGLLLAGVGIYSVVSYSVAQRSAEFGLRMAVGAQRGDIVRMVLASVGTVMAIGASLGVAASLALGRYAESMLFGVTPHDPSALLISVAVLGIAGVLAALVPAWRAVRIDPMAVLRVE